MSASRAWESGGHAGARHVAEGAAGGFGELEIAKQAAFHRPGEIARHDDAVHIHRIGKRNGQRLIDIGEQLTVRVHAALGGTAPDQCGSGHEQ